MSRVRDAAGLVENYPTCPYALAREYDSKVLQEASTWLATRLRVVNHALDVAYEAEDRDR